jgi:hypothetical protein
MSSADLVKELTSNASLLMKRQVKLATLEAKQELQKGKIMAGAFGAAGFFAYAGFVLLVVAAAMGIGAALDHQYWAGALIAAGCMFIPAGIAAAIGYEKRIKSPMKRTRAEIGKEITWARYRTSGTR